MSSKHLGADMVFAWPSAEIAVMGAEGAANIIHRREIREAENPAEKERKKLRNMKTFFSNPYDAASIGFVDAVIKAF